jgi:hypothetical protein
MAREPKADGAGPLPGKRQTKTAQVLVLLTRPEGATLDQLVAATGWLPHSARAAMTGMKKKGHLIGSEKPAGGVRTYRIERVAEASR